ncbi:MAG: alanine--glyoxylate aminotransferase family protein [Candidatus Heimdallarchaeota archaeon]|nr:MAG: alanine--glyoxylate aminotransferase family protein [Candidatus Heimdallarchaeota archaeon]
MHKRLLIPGPTEVKSDVLKQQAKPLIGHRPKEFTELYTGIFDKLQKFHKTKQWVTVPTASGTLFMDMTARSLVKERALCCVNGAFSKRCADTITACGKEIEKIDVEWGKAIKPEMILEKLDSGKFDTLTLCHNETSTGVRNPIYEIGKAVKKDYPEVMYVIDSVSAMGGDKVVPEEIQCDLIYASTQKAYALPPGLAIGFVSEAAIKRTAEVPNRGRYTDLKGLYDYYMKKQQTPSTPNVSLLYALSYQLDRMLEETSEGRHKRHEEMAKWTQEWAKKHFEMFPEPGYESITVSTIKNTQGKSVADLNKELAKRDYMISNGYGDLKEKTFRIGHMGEWTTDDIKDVCSHIEEIWEL